MKQISRGKIEVKPSTLFCRYCVGHKKAKIRDPKKVLRYCRPKAKWVDSRDKGCKKFRPAKWFWCDECEYWITLNECENRRSSGMMETFKKLKCSSCDRQHFHIDRVIRYSEEHFAKAPTTKALTRKKKTKKLTRKPATKKLKKISKSVKPKRVISRTSLKKPKRLRRAS